MANIMSQLKLKNNTSRNGFDLSRKNAFTAKVGELLPVACIECIPGDVVKGRVQHFTRTMPVNTAAYTRIREYYDWFFVPTNLLWNKFNQFVTQMTRNSQHATSISSSQILTTQHPYFTVSQVYSLLKAVNGKNNEHGFNFSKTAAKLLSYLDYGDYSNFNESNITYTANVALNPFPLLAYQKIYSDYFRNSQWERPAAPSFNIDYIDGSASSLNIPITNIAAGTFTYDNMFKLRYANWNKDLFMGTLPSAQYGDAASINVGGGSGTLNLTLGNPTDFRFLNRIQIDSDQSVSSGTPLVVRGDSINAPNFANVMPQGVSDYVYSILNADAVSNLRNSLGLSSSSVSGTASITQTFSILALRQAEALQKWKEITQSQQQDYKNQIEAHFGVSMSDAYSERCRYIDGSVSSLDISEVTNTNLADNNAAEIAGKGVGVGDGSFKFSSDVHGYLMCIYHASPLLEYGIDGISKINTKTMVTDYAIPEFDKTGMVQVPFVELTNRLHSSYNTLLGYAPRYYDYKTAVDKVRGAFITGGLGAWVAPIDHNYINNYFAVLVGMRTVTAGWFKINPAVLNPIFAQDVGDDVDTDQLLVNTSFDITAVRNLDRNGLPY